MTDDASFDATGADAGGPLPAAPKSRKSIFDLRSVAPLSPEEQAVRAEAMERTLAFGAEPVRDERGWALEVDFIEANGEAVEPWQHDRRHKRLYRRDQKLAKAAGQLIGQPGDKIEFAKRLAVLHHREGSDVEGAVRRGLFDAIWRYDHVFDGYTVPRRYGTHFMKTGRVAAVAEEQRRQWQAEGRAPADAFWVRNRRNTGLVLVSPNPNPDAPSDAIEATLDEDVPLVRQSDNEEASKFSQPQAVDPESTETLGTEVGDDQSLRFDYPGIPVTLKPDTTRTVLSDGSAAPVINLSEDRTANILADESAVFEIADSPTASGKGPTYALHEKGYWAVRDHEDMIEEEARAQKVDPDLVKAIMYVENAHGASYGHFFEFIGVSESILPMNIKPEKWEELIGENADFSDTLVNIRAGVTLIRRIRDRIRIPTVAKIASIYIYTGRENVNDYGARVAEVYAERTWEILPPEETDLFVNEYP